MVMGSLLEVVWNLYHHVVTNLSSVNPVGFSSNPSTTLAQITVEMQNILAQESNANEQLLLLIEESIQI